MLSALQIVSPLILIIFLGFFSFKREIFNKSLIDALNKFVYLIPIPALLFRNTATIEFPEIFPLELWGAYFGSMLITSILGVLLSMSISKNRPFKGNVIIGFGSAFSNTVMLGIPVVLTALGDEAGIPLFLILAVHGIISFSVVTVLLEISSKTDTNLKGTFVAIGRSLSGLPVILALVAGLSWNATDLTFPIYLDKFLEILSGAAIPIALFAIGGSLTQIKIEGSIKEALIVTFFKLGIHPFVAFILASYLFKLPFLWIATVTILASMPSGIFTSVFAVRYGTAEDIASSSIVISTVLSSITISLWLTFFIVNYP